MTTEIAGTPYESYLTEHTNIELQANRLANSIKDEATYRAASTYLLDIAAMRKKWAEFIKPAVKAAHEAHAKIKAVENAVDEPLKRAAELALKPALSLFEQAEEERRRQEQERINRDLRKQDEDNRLATAEELEKSGKKAEAEAVLATPTAPEVVIPKTTTVKGISYRTKYSARVVDPSKLLDAIAKGFAPANFVEPNMKVLNGIATAMKEAVEGQWKDWGLELVKERVVSASGGQRG